MYFVIQVYQISNNLLIYQLFLQNQILIFEMELVSYKINRVVREEYRKQFYPLEWIINTYVFFYYHIKQYIKPKNAENQN